MEMFDNFALYASRLFLLCNYSFVLRWWEKRKDLEYVVLSIGTREDKKSIEMDLIAVQRFKQYTWLQYDWVASDFVMVPLDFQHALTYGEYNLRHWQNQILSNGID